LSELPLFHQEFKPQLLSELHNQFLLHLNQDQLLMPDQPHYQLLLNHGSVPQFMLITEDTHTGDNNKLLLLRRKSQRRILQQKNQKRKRKMMI